jgi:hypothetical protein
MATKKTITVQGTEIRFYYEREEDFLSLTDIARKFDERTGRLIANWLRTRSTVSFLEAWELLHNQDFNILESEYIKNRTGDNAFVLSVVDWREKTNAIGIRAKKGRYGGTYAHRDIAFEFASWLSPTFKLYVFKEFQRLKEVEAKEKHETLEWNVKRLLSKVNYKIQTDAIKKNLIPSNIKSGIKGYYYASEADLLNMAMFGMTAKEWRNINSKMKGNLRDNATHEQLLVLANLETHNAEFIKEGLSQEERLEKLNEIAIYQMRLLVNIEL